MHIYLERGPDGKEELRVEGLSPEQQQLFDERKFLLRMKVQPSARPKNAKIVTCFSCGEPGTIWVGNKGMREIVVDFFLLLQGWIFGDRGYQCPVCYERDIKAMVRAAHRLSGTPSNEVEGNVVPVPEIEVALTFESMVERLMALAEEIDPDGQQISVRSNKATRTLRLRQVNDPRPIAGEFDLSSPLGFRGAIDWLATMARRLAHGSGSQAQGGKARDLSLFPRTQVRTWLSYDYSPQEKELLLAILAERFGIHEVDEIPVNEAHERLLSFFIDVTASSYQPLRAFLKQQRHAGGAF